MLGKYSGVACIRLMTIPLKLIHDLIGEKESRDVTIETEIIVNY
jgi:hypothetical protein